MSRCTWWQQPPKGCIGPAARHGSAVCAAAAATRCFGNRTPNPLVTHGTPRCAASSGPANSAAWCTTRSGGLAARTGDTPRNIAAAAIPPKIRPNITSGITARGRLRTSAGRSSRPASSTRCSRPATMASTPWALTQPQLSGPVAQRASFAPVLDRLSQRHHRLEVPQADGVVISADTET